MVRPWYSRGTRRADDRIRGSRPAENGLDHRRQLCIGASLAVELAAHGWQVAASGRDCARAPDDIHGFALDATDMNANRRTAADIAGGLGPIDLTVFNAGISKPGPAVTFHAETVKRTTRINYFVTNPYSADNSDNTAAAR